MIVKNTLLPIQTTIQSKGRLMDLSVPVVMGILNSTPDSFYNKGRDSHIDDLLRTAEKMIKDGAGLLDIGGASTRPGAVMTDVNTELERVVPLVYEISRRFPEVWLSVDTYHAKVAREGVAAGASLINDVSSGRFDTDMMATVAALKVPYFAMHLQGTPATMQADPKYNDVTAEVREYLRGIMDQCNEHGIADLIIDPGFGFGKTLEHNFRLLNDLHTFRIFGRPVLAGLSRKSMICKALKVSPEDALNGTTALNMIALQQGASILRVHDVKEAAETIKLYQMLC